MFRLDHLYQWSPWFFCWLSLSCCDNVWGLFWGLFVGLLKFWSNMGSETCETGLELGNVVGLGPRDNELCWVRGEVLVKLTGLLCCCWLVVAWLLWCWLWSWPWTCPGLSRSRRTLWVPPLLASDSISCSWQEQNYYLMKHLIGFTFSLWAACTFFLAAAMSGTGSVNSMVSSSLGLVQVDTPVAEL